MCSSQPSAWRPRMRVKVLGLKRERRELLCHFRLKGRRRGQRSSCRKEKVELEMLRRCGEKTIEDPHLRMERWQRQSFEVRSYESKEEVLSFWKMTIYDLCRALTHLAILGVKVQLASMHSVCKEYFDVFYGIEPLAWAFCGFVIVYYGAVLKNAATKYNIPVDKTRSPKVGGFQGKEIENKEDMEKFYKPS
eukprot:s282_g17.t1